MKNPELAFRQIHLDFHTFGDIPGIGSRFDPEEFAATLERAHVNSINLFSRCHHGYNYYYSTTFPEWNHPHLERDLLREQIEACHARGIRTPIYLTVGWDQRTWDEHPEWRVVEPNGRPNGPGPYEDGFWHNLCLNSPFVDLLEQRIDDIFENFAPLDGLWLDIIQPKDCSCASCLKGMSEQGLEPALAQDRAHYAWQVWQNFQHRIAAYIRARQPECLIFFNCGHLGPQHRSVVDDYSHFEIESLPSGGWGYKHFDMAMLYTRNLGKQALGMTGKFHTMWGDFHSFKNQAALEYECFKMLALNAKCCIGDQLHPTGKICQTTYELIGAVYQQVEQREPWCAGAVPLTEIAVLTPEEFHLALQHPVIEGDTGKLRPILGAIRILQEAGYQFDILDSQHDLTGYQVLILPDAIPVSEALAAKIDDFLADGGALIASYAAGMNAAETEFTLTALSVSPEDQATYDVCGKPVRGKYYHNHNYVDYLVPRQEMLTGLTATEYVMYMRGMRVNADDGATVLATLAAPYFDRTYRHYMSHRQTPSSGADAGPGIVQHGRCIYFVHPVFSQYQVNAPHWCKQFVLNALQRLLPEPLIRTNAPSTALITLNAQPRHNRWVLHVLHYIAERRSDMIDVLEDKIPLYNIAMSVKTDTPVKTVTSVPDGEELPFTTQRGYLEFTVPYVNGHRMIAIVFE